MDSRRILLNGFNRRILHAGASLTIATYRSGASHVVPTTSGSPLPPSDDRVATEGGHQRGEGDDDEDGLADGRSDDEVERGERVQGEYGTAGPAATSRRPDRDVIDANVAHGGPGIVEAHAVRRQSTPVVHQIVANPGKEIRANDLGAGRRLRSRDVARQSGVHGDRTAATGVDELQS